MRVSYSEDECYPGQFELWQANCRRSLKGRKGQAALQELEQALLAMPDKRIHRDVLVQPSGEVCAIGALRVEQKVCEGLSRSEAVAVLAEIDPDYTEEVGVEAGMPTLVAWSVAVENDLDPWRMEKRSSDWTPEERYQRMLRWVQVQLGRDTDA